MGQQNIINYLRKQGKVISPHMQTFVIIIDSLINHIGSQPQKLLVFTSKLMEHLVKKLLLGVAEENNKQNTRQTDLAKCSSYGRPSVCQPDRVRLAEKKFSSWVKHKEWHLGMSFLFQNRDLGVLPVMYSQYRQNFSSFKDLMQSKSLSK